MPCSTQGLVEGEGFKLPTRYLAPLLERTTQLGQRRYLNTLLSVKKLPYIVQTCRMLAGKGVVLNCINSEYELKHELFLEHQNRLRAMNTGNIAHYQPVGETRLGQGTATC